MSAPDEAVGFPVSHAQERLWFMEQMNPGGAMLNLNNSVRLSGTPAVEALERTLADMARRHETLRTCFRVIEGRPMQVVLPIARVRVAVHNITEGGDEDRQLTRLLQNEAVTPFDLARCPLFRFSVIRLRGPEYVLSLTMNHLISDGWSLGVFWHELSVLSAALAQDRPCPLPELPIQYGDFTLWQREQLEAGALASQLTYWKEQLRDLRHLELVTDHPRPPVQTFVGRHHKLRIGPRLTAAVGALAAQTRATTFMVLLAAFQILLGRYTEEDDVPVGSYVAGRNPPEVESLIGLFLNTIVLRTDLSGAPTFRQVLERVRAMTLEAYGNQDVPFATLVQELQPDRDLSLNPLVQIVFQLINVPTPNARQPDRKPLLDVESGTSLFDLTCTLWEFGDEIHGHLEYNSDLFEARTIERLASHFEVLLQSIVSAPDTVISRLPLMSDGQRDRVIAAANATAHAVGDVGIASRLAAQVEATPDAVAFACDGVVQTYAQLGRRVDELAASLRQLGVGPGVPVGVCIGRSLDSAAAMLAVIQRAGIYVPLHPADGTDRLERIAREARVRAIVADAARAPRLRALAVQLLVVDDPAAAPRAAVQPLPPANPCPDLSNVACLVYTSGSTGQPKGATVVHGEILSRLAWMWRTYPFGPHEVGCHKTAISFIDSLWELLGALLAGVPTVIVPEPVTADLEAFVGVLATERVTRLWLVPSLLQALLAAFDDLGERLPDLGFWVVSGEALRIDLYEAFTRALPGTTLYNVFGTSEVWDATWWDPRSAPPPTARVPIGKPIDNRSAFVLDRGLEPCPVGVPGELYVGGIEPLLGYAHNPALTAERFIAHPYAQSPGERLFRTRDRARMLESGDIEILGRLDHQLKIRGLRVELGDVEEALERHPAVRQAVVVVHRRGAEQTLVAHVAADEGVTASELRRHVKDRLPSHAIPARYELHAELPRTGTGKLDREALARAPFEETDRALPNDREPPVGAVELAVYEIWREVLTVDELGVTDNFFDVGGHSLLLYQVYAKLGTLTRTQVSMNDMFRYPTIRTLADLLSEGADSMEGVDPTVSGVERGAR